MDIPAFIYLMHVIRHYRMKSLMQKINQNKAEQTVREDHPNSYNEGVTVKAGNP